MEILEPLDDTIAKAKSTKLSVKTKPGNTIVVSTDADTIAKQASMDGTFTTNLTLNEGSNMIAVYSYDEKGTEESKTVSVFYSSQSL